MSKTPFYPFDNDEQVLTIGELSIENGLDSIEIYGELSIAKDAQGLAKAQALKAFADRLLARFDDMPFDKQTPKPTQPEQIDNPFA